MESYYLFCFLKIRLYVFSGQDRCFCQITHARFECSCFTAYVLRCATLTGWEQIEGADCFPSQPFFFLFHRPEAQTVPAKLTLRFGSMLVTGNMFSPFSRFMCLIKTQVQLFHVPQQCWSVCSLFTITLHLKVFIFCMQAGLLSRMHHSSHGSYSSSITKFSHYSNWISGCKQHGSNFLNVFLFYLEQFTRN